MRCKENEKKINDEKKKLQDDLQASKSTNVELANVIQNFLENDRENLMS